MQIPSYAFASATAIKYNDTAILSTKYSHTNYPAISIKYDIRNQKPML